MEKEPNVLSAILQVINESEESEIELTELLKRTAPKLGYKRYTAKELSNEIEKGLEIGTDLGLLTRNNKIISAPFLNFNEEEDQTMANDEQCCKRRRRRTTCRRRRRRNNCHRRRKRRC